MRKLLAVLLLSIGSAARSAAQEAQIQNAASLEAAALESAQTGLVEEPRFVTIELSASRRLNHCRSRGT